jgi:hypothetical protein
MFSFFPQEDTRMQPGEGTMEGSKVGTMNGEGPSERHETLRPPRATADAGERVDLLRTRPIAATVEVPAQRSHPGMSGTGYMRTAA